jgi:hypothetical protein
MMRLRHTRLGGAEGNERLTAAISLVLLGLLVTEAATTLDLSVFLSVHLFLGLLLVPAVSLKLASVTWRAGRYYMGSSEYRLLGPPQIVLRLLAPPLVLATVILFGSGVGFLVTGRNGGLLRTLHALSFAVWGALMIVHVLFYARQVLTDGLADWRRRPRAGGRLRRGLVVATLAAGVVLALATWSAQRSWLAHHHDRGGDARAQRSSLGASLHRSVSLAGAPRWRLAPLPVARIALTMRGDMRTSATPTRSGCPHAASPTGTPLPPRVSVGPRPVAGACLQRRRRPWG